MSQATDTLEDDWLNYWLRGVAPSWASATDWYLSLHTADPGEGGNQQSSEISYTGYARQAVARSTGWNAASGGLVDNNAQIQFGQMTAGAGGTVTHIGIGTASSGAGSLLARFALSASLAVSNGINPTLAAGTLEVTAA